LITRRCLANVVAQCYRAVHPHPPALGSGDLVPNPLSGDLALKLRERQEHIERQAAHRAGRVELLGDRNKRHRVRIEQLDDLGEVGQGAGEPIHLVHHYDIDDPLADVGQQPLQGRTLHGSTREPAVVIGGPDQPPAFAVLTLDERLAPLALGVERVKVLLQSLLRGLAGVYGATARLKFTAFHRDSLVRVP
jgi:hypothetical protein